MSMSMFSRKFMREFPIRKYARISGASGSINTDMNLIGRRDYIPYRIATGVLVTVSLILAYSNFQFVYEIGHHYSPPPFFTKYDLFVPQSVKGPNDQIIQNFQTIHQTIKWKKSFI